jgi:hypothetical protein
MTKHNKPEDDDGAGKTAPKAKEFLAIVIAEHEAALAADPTRSMADPTLPLFQYWAMASIEMCRRRFLDGDDFAMMKAIRTCANHDLVMPQWLAQAYIERFDAVLNYQAKTWDEVFGSPTEEGKQLAALRKRRKLQPQIFSKVRALTDAGMSVEVAIETAGQALGVGRSLAWEYYLEFKEHFQNPESRAEAFVEIVTTPENFKTLRSDKPKS